jgi:hypothetical protein
VRARPSSSSAAGLLLLLLAVAALVPGGAADAALAASGVRPLQAATTAGAGNVEASATTPTPEVAIPGVTSKVGNSEAASPSPSQQHSPAFDKWMEKFDKARKYCPSAPPPCEESLYREQVFAANVAKIELHNAAKKAGGMKLGVTRFADLTEVGLYRLNPVDP